MARAVACVSLRVEFFPLSRGHVMSGERTRLGQSIVIRPIRSGDQAGVRGCKGGTLEQVDQQVRWTVADRGPGVLEHLVAEVAGELVGTAMLMRKGAHASVAADGHIDLCQRRIDPRVGTLADWVVAGEQQRQGVGSARGAAMGSGPRRDVDREPRCRQRPGQARLHRVRTTPRPARALARRTARDVLRCGSVTTQVGREE